MNKFVRTITNPLRAVLRVVSPKAYVKLQYKTITGNKLNLENPVKYTEKLQYLRLYTYPKDKLVCKCAGRIGAREYLKNIGYERLLIKEYGIFDSFDEIDFDALPTQCVIKTTHSSQMNYIVWDKFKENWKKLKRLFNRYLRINYGRKTCEPHYSKIKPQILVEKLLLENDTTPIEYKIHCFNGKAKSMYIVTGRGKDIRYTNYYIDWKRFDGSQFNGWKSADKDIEKPANWDEMVKIAEDLAKPFPFVRVDLYNINERIYFSELTFTPAKGTLKFDDEKADYEMGEWLQINTKKN